MPRYKIDFTNIKCQICGIPLKGRNRNYREYDLNKNLTGNWVCSNCYNNKWVKNNGFVDINEYNRLKSWERGENSPMESNDNCTSNFGVYKGESLFKRFLEEIIFEHVEITGYHDGGIDFKCYNPRQEFINKYPQLKMEMNKEYKTQLKLSCLSFRKGDNGNWNYYIQYNDSPDFFIFN